MLEWERGWVLGCLLEEASVFGYVVIISFLAGRLLFCSHLLHHLCRSSIIIVYLLGLPWYSASFLLWHPKLTLFTLPAQPQGTVSDSFLSFLSCRRSRRILFLTRFFFLLLLSYPAGDSGRVLFLTRFFFLSSFFLLSFFFLLSGNTSFSHTSLHPILTKLSQNDRYLDHYSGTDNGGVRGHDGVTGVKKVIFTKKASSPTEYIALTRDLCICSSLTPSTKVMVLKN